MFDDLVHHLQHADAGIRYDAAHKLGASNDLRATSPLIGVLHDSNAKVQYAAVSGLIKLGASEAAEPIIMLLLDSPGCRVWDLMKLNIGMRLRNGLLDMMQRSNADALVLNRLTAAVDSGDFDEQQRALFVRLLGRSGDTVLVDPLIEMLAHHSRMMQGAAAEALGWLGDTRATTPLLDMLGKDDKDLREIAIEALGRIGSEAAVEPLMAMLEDDSEWVRRSAADALGNLGDRRAVEPLSRALQDYSAVVQDAAFEALKKLSYGNYSATI